MHSASNPADAFPPTSSKMAYSTPVHIREDLCERGQLQDPFCDHAVVRIWAAIISTFTEVQLHLIDYSCTSERTLAITVALKLIFFSSFNTSLSLKNNIVIRLCCWAHLRTCKPGKSDMFLSKVKTKVSKGSEFSTNQLWKTTARSDI